MEHPFTRRGFIGGLAALLATAKAQTQSTEAATPPSVTAPPQELLLLSCHIAGTSYRKHLKDLEPSLSVGTVLHLRREPENSYDNLAIAVYDPTSNAHLGYLPRAKNQVLASLLDAGKQLDARLTAKEWLNRWLKLSIEVYLHEGRAS